MESLIRVMIVDDHEMIRKGIKSWLDAEEGIEVVAESNVGSGVLEMLGIHHPDVLLLDLHLPDTHGIDVIRKLRSSGMTTPILVMTGYEKQRARAVLEAGANGFLNKEEKRERVIEAVRWAAAGEQGTWLGPAAAAEWIESNKALEMANLTKAELRVLELLELTNTEIGEKLFISEGTVKNYVTIIYSKLDVKNRADAIKWAKKHAILATRR